MPSSTLHFREIDPLTHHTKFTLAPENIQPLIRRLTVGPDQLPTDYATRIRAFLREYLGDERTQVPFGGRGEDMARLCMWLANDDEPPCLLITAEAGRGKSALLVRWCAYLEQFNDMEVVFMPISIRFETAAKEVFYAALAARLAAIYGEIASYQPIGADQWKGICNQYLEKSRTDGRKIVLVVDGLDEVIGWQAGASFVPIPLPHGVRVVASTRLQAEKTELQWLRQVGWNAPHIARTMALSHLTQMGIEHVLLQMGNPLDRLVTKVNVTRELLRLTQGDPLVVRLYVEALVQQGDEAATLTAEQLAYIQPGIEGYLQQWWEDQSRQWDGELHHPMDTQQVRTFFNALATAFGPLSSDDILRVSNIEGMDGLQLKIIAKMVGRFVIGDGKERGYTFSHPRLGYYFFDQLGKLEQEFWNNRYVQYGISTLHSLREQKRISWSDSEIQPYSYILQHYIQHLDRAKAQCDIYYEIICHEWAQGWQALRGTYDGYLIDVIRVWEQAKNDPNEVRGITMQMWCALCQSSIITLNSNISIKLLLGALQEGAISRAQGLVILRRNFNERYTSETLVALCKAFEPDKESLRELLEVVQLLGDDASRVQVLRTIATYLPVEVLQVARFMRDNDARIQVLTAVAPYLPNPNDSYEEILRIVPSLQDDTARVQVLTALAPHLPNEVMKFSKVLRHETSRIQVLTSVAPNLSNPNDGYRELLQIAVSLQDDSLCVQVLKVVAPHLPDEVLQIVQYLRDDVSRVQVLIAIAPHLPNEVLQLTQFLQEEVWRVEILAILAPHLPDKVLHVAQTMANNGFGTRAHVLAAVAPYFPIEVLAIVVSLWDDAARAQVLAALAPHLPNEVMKFSQVLRDEISRTKVLISVAPYLPHEVLEIARSLRDQALRLEVILAAVPYMSDSVNVYNDALKIAESIQDDVARGRILTAIVPFIEDPTTVYQKLVQLIHTLPSDLSRSELLRAAAHFVPNKVLTSTKWLRDDTIRTQFLAIVAPYTSNEMLQLAQSYEDNISRAEVLIATAPYAPNEVFKAAYSIRNNYHRARVLIAVAPHVLHPNIIYQEILQIARDLGDRVSLTHILVAIAPDFPREVLQIARSLPDETSRLEVMTDIASHLPDPVSAYQEVLQTVQSIRDDEYRLGILVHIAPYLSDSSIVYHEVLRIVPSLQDDGARARVLTALAPHLPNEVVKFSQLLQDDTLRIQVLTSVAPYLPYEVLQGVRFLPDEASRALVLTSIAPHLPNEVLAIVQFLWDDVSRVPVLRAIAPFLPVEVLQVCRFVWDNNARAQVLTAVAPYLPNPNGSFQEILRIIPSLQDDAARAQLLTAVAPYLPNEVIKFSQTLRDEISRTKVLISVAPYLPHEASRIAQSLKDEVLRLEVMLAAVPYISDSDNVYDDALQFAESLQDHVARARILTTITVSKYHPAYIYHRVLDIVVFFQNPNARVWVSTTSTPDQPTKLMLATPSSQDEASRAQVLEAVAPFLPAEVLRMADSIRNDNERVRVLTAVARAVAQGTSSAHQTTLKGEWESALKESAMQLRNSLLQDITALLPFTLKLVDSKHQPKNSYSVIISLTVSQRNHLLTLLQHLDIATHLQRTHFIDTLGIPHELRNELHFDVSQTTFVRDLLSVLERTEPAVNGEYYLAKFLRYLHDVEWAGHPEHQNFLDGLLRNSPAPSAQAQLAQGVLEAIQTVCLWWP